MPRFHSLRRRLAVTSTLAALVTALGAACGETEPLVGPPPLGPAVRVAVSPEAVEMISGSRTQLVGAAYDQSGRHVTAAITWVSLDPAIATVTVLGAVTAVSPGETSVMASAGPLTASAVVKVLDLAGNLAVSRVTASGTSFQFDVLLRLSDGTLQSLPRPPGISAITAADWSPDGRTVAVVVIDPGSIVSAGEDGISYSSDIYLFDTSAPAGSPWLALTSNGTSHHPRWSPDGRRIAFTARSVGSGYNNIYVVDVNGGVPLRVTPNDGFISRASWSPDGSRLAFSDWTVGNGDIFVVNADGTGLANLTGSAAMEAEPSWSPDGGRIAFVRNLDSHDGNDIYVMAATGGSLVQLYVGGWNSNPAWSPDGRYVAFTNHGGPDPGSGIYVMTADRSFRIRLIPPPSSGYLELPAWRH